MEDGEALGVEGERLGNKLGTVLDPDVFAIGQDEQAAPPVGGVDEVEELGGGGHAGKENLRCHVLHALETAPVPG